MRGGERGSGGNKTKEAGIAIAAIGAVATLCAAGLNSGAYAKVCPAFVCPTPGPSTSASPAPLGDGKSPTSKAVAGSPADVQADRVLPPPASSGQKVDRAGSGNSSGRDNSGTASNNGNAGSGSQQEVEPIGDFSVSLLQDYGCILRSGDGGLWDIDIWYTINWTSPDDHPMPNGNLRVVTDLDRSKNWSLNALGSPGGYLDTFVEQDDRYLGRFVTVRATIKPDREVPESSMGNNSLELSVDLRGGLPPAGTNQRVACTKT